MQGVQKVKARLRVDRNVISKSWTDCLCDGGKRRDVDATFTWPKKGIHRGVMDSN